MSKLKIGIQGGRGSFNEEACITYCELRGWTDYEIYYLYRTDPLLKALEDKKINLAQFALYNNYGGLVTESMEPLGKYKFKFEDEYRHKISHHLMIHPEVDFKEIDTVMSHPQVFLQCKLNFQSKYPDLKLISGEGDLIDSGRAAQALSSGEISKNHAICGCFNLSTAHNLKIIESNLQDSSNNLTSFIWVS
jgi:chorismate mutase/prephenate dehydratase